MSTRTVRIPTTDLVNGWRQIVQVELPWTCPVCGGPRGDVHDAIAYDGRYRMHVDGWTNPCGHVDKYEDVERHAYVNGQVLARHDREWRSAWQAKHLMRAEESAR